MKIRNYSLCTSRLKLAVAAAIADLLLNSIAAPAQTLSGSLTVTGSTVLQGGVSVTGTADFQGNDLLLGTVTSGPNSGLPGVSAIYMDGDTSTFSLISSRPSHQWIWGYSLDSETSAPMMTLDSINGLTIYDASGSPAIVLNPNPASSNGPTSVLTQQVADTRYVSSANFSVGLVNGYPAVALPGGNATGAASFAGIQATASGHYSNASGYGSTASGDASNAIGISSTASEIGSTASGLGSKATGRFTTASGPYSAAVGNSSIASGNSSYSSGIDSTATGPGSSATGDFSTSSGYWSVASGSLSIATGNWATASAFGSTASGLCSTASGYYSTASTPRSNASGYAQFVAGQYNIPQGNSTAWDTTDELFTLGNGSGPQSLSDALVVQKSGDTTIYGQLTVSGTANSGIVVTGTPITVNLPSGTVTKIVASGTNQMVLIPEQGDLSMGDFINGAQPYPTNPSQATQQTTQSLSPSQTTQRAGIPNASGSTSAITGGMLRALKRDTTVIH